MRWTFALSLAAALLFPASPASAQFVAPVQIRSWSAGTGGIGLDASANVFVAWSNSVRAYSRDGALLRSWGSRGNGDGQLNGARDVAIGPDGNVYVADTQNNRIQVFTPGGVFLRKWGSYGTGDGQFSSPTTIDIAPDGTVFVLDALNVNHRVQVFTSAGQFVRRWSVATYPGRLALDGFGGVWVTDYLNGTARRYSLTGASQMYLGNTSAMDYPFAIEVDRLGRIYVGTISTGILVFSPSGERLGSFAVGTDPQDFAFDADDNLYVSSGDNLIVFSTQFATPTRTGTWGGLKALYR